MTDANDPTSQTPEETAFWRRAEKQSVSAETGGEKAADESRKPEIFLSLHSNGGFFRDRRDMTIRLLADYKSFLERSPKADSREPEKLNNAHDSRYSTETMLLPCAKCGERRAHVNHYAEYGGDHKFALAESSLSSPPQKEKA